MYFESDTVKSDCPVLNDEIIKDLIYWVFG